MAATLVGATLLSCGGSLPEPAHGHAPPDVSLGEGSYIRRLPASSALKTSVVTLVSIEHGDYCHMVAKPADGSPDLQLIVAHDDLGVCHDEGAGPAAKRWGDRRLRAVYRAEYYCEHEPPCAEDEARLGEGLVLVGLSPVP